MNKELIRKVMLIGSWSFVLFLMHDLIGLSLTSFDLIFRGRITALSLNEYQGSYIVKGILNFYYILVVLSYFALIATINKQGDKLFRIGVYLLAIMNVILLIQNTLFGHADYFLINNSTSDVLILIIDILITVIGISGLILILYGSKRTVQDRLMAKMVLVILIIIAVSNLLSLIFPSVIVGVSTRVTSYSFVFFNSCLALYGYKPFVTWEKTRQIEYIQ